MIKFNVHLKLVVFNYVVDTGSQYIVSSCLSRMLLNDGSTTDIETLFLDGL